jgi:hypothetical protein
MMNNSVSEAGPKEYNVICSDNLSDLEKQVSAELKNGWSVAGGIAVDFNRTACLYQAVVK